VAAVDAEVIHAIGPAPKVGRPRWLMLAEKASGPEAAKIAKRVVEGNGFETMDSNARFAAVLSALLEIEARPARGEQRPAATRNKGIAWIEKSGRSIQLVSKEKAFGAFLEDRLPSLLVEFAELTSKAKSPSSPMGE
jgi:ParB family transcriptional regulator, chromosome partitioning protein